MFILLICIVPLASCFFILDSKATISRNSGSYAAGLLLGVASFFLTSIVYKIGNPDSNSLFLRFLLFYSFQYVIPFLIFLPILLWFARTKLERVRFRLIPVVFGLASISLPMNIVFNSLYSDAWVMFWMPAMLFSALILFVRLSNIHVCHDILDSIMQVVLPVSSVVCFIFVLDSMYFFRVSDFFTYSGVALLALLGIVLRILTGIQHSSSQA